MYGGLTSEFKPLESHTNRSSLGKVRFYEKGMISIWIHLIIFWVAAIIGYTLLRNIFNDITLGILLSAVAGIMVFISLDELLPTARKYGEHHLAIYGLIAGMVVMEVSLLLFI